MGINKLHDEAAASKSNVALSVPSQLPVRSTVQICLRREEGSYGIQDTMQMKNYMYEMFTALVEFCPAGLDS